jgi:diguanylate cyclase (GGDEF)-like protein
MSLAARAGSTWHGLTGWLTSRELDPHLRAALMDTLIQRRPAVFISCAAILLMSASAAWLVAAPWAIAWLGADILLLGYRLRLSFRHDKGNGPIGGHGAVLATMFIVFILFGLGCATAIASGPTVLMVMAVISMMGVFAGLVSRWAAFPRLGLLTLGALAVMVAAALAERTGEGLGLAAIQFLLIASTTGAQTVQNHRNLRRMLEAERANWLMARLDSLTGLGNRIRLVEALDAACARLAADPFDPRRHFALLYLDLDGFKAVNDSLGHEAGDRLLERLGGVLAGAIRERDRAFRVGGDEFIILADGAGIADATGLARRILAAIPACQSGRFRATASIGITIACTEGAEPAALLAEADAALYFAKGKGKARFHLYGDEAIPLAEAC